MTNFLSHRDLLIRFATICIMIVTFLVKHDAAIADSPQKPAMRIEKEEDTTAWYIYSGDSLVSGYVADSGGKPIIYPIHGPGGHPMTRNFPMRKDYGTENGDHDHQRSMWFTHGDINGIDFWTDDKGSGKIFRCCPSGQSRSWCLYADSDCAIHVFHRRCGEPGSPVDHLFVW